jgi:3-deoxy-D-manno-octulosonic acid kinase
VDPEPYSFEQRGNQSAYALRAVADDVFAALFAGEGCTALSNSGRAPVRVFRISNGEGILRDYRRGGLAALFLQNAFIGNRMLQEFEVHRYLFAEGARVPEVLGVAWKKHRVFYRGSIATRRIPGETLLEFLMEDENEKRSACLLEAGKAIRGMHDKGVWHADLQLKNLMVAGEDVWIIDLDGARKSPSLRDSARARNLLRLRRSFEKHGVALGNFATLLAGYGPIVIPSWLDWAYRFRGATATVRGTR